MKKKKKHKYHHYYVKLTSNPNIPAKNSRLSNGSLRFWQIVLTLIIIVIPCFVAYENYISTMAAAKESILLEQIAKLEEEKAELIKSNAELSDQNNILSETINQKSDVIVQMEDRKIPSGFPLSGAADYKEKDEELRLDGQTIKRPMLEFTASSNAYVVSPADGVISLVAEERTYGFEVQIDHGNGYVTSYRTATEPTVKVGEEISKGAFLVALDSTDEDASKLAYQILYNDEYINPIDYLEISG